MSDGWAHFVQGFLIGGVLTAFGFVMLLIWNNHRGRSPKR